MRVGSINFGPTIVPPSADAVVEEIQKLQNEIRKLHNVIRDEWPPDQAEEIINNCK